MPRKLILSEAFEGATKEIVFTTRIPESLFSLLEEDAKTQGTSIAALGRGLISFHYVAQHLKSKLGKGSALTSNDLGLFESLRAHIQDLTGQLQEIDALRGQTSDTQRLDEGLRRLVEEAVEQALASKLVGFEKAWNNIASRTRKKGGN